MEYEPAKRLVLSGLSKYHTQLDQFAFMPDRHDTKHTSVRYISTLKLREWRFALQPVLGSKTQQWMHVCTDQVLPCSAQHLQDMVVPGQQVTTSNQCMQLNNRRSTHPGCAAAAATHQPLMV